MQEDDEDEESEDEELDSSVGFSLNARLLQAAALREQGASVAMDPEWEQYLKEAQERGELNIDATREALRNLAGQINQLNQAQQASAAEQPQAFQAPAAPA